MRVLRRDWTLKAKCIDSLKRLSHRIIERYQTVMLAIGSGPITANEFIKLFQPGHSSATLFC